MPAKAASLGRVFEPRFLRQRSDEGRRTAPLPSGLVPVPTMTVPSAETLRAVYSRRFTQLGQGLAVPTRAKSAVCPRQGYPRVSKLIKWPLWASSLPRSTSPPAPDPPPFPSRSSSGDPKLSLTLSKPSLVSKGRTAGFPAQNGRWLRCGRLRRRTGALERLRSGGLGEIRLSETAP